MESGNIKLKDIKPELTEYIKEALVLLKQAPVPDENTIHDIRVLMKKSRAVMKLISDQVEADSFQRDFNAYREVGKLLSTWREASVHRRTLKDIKKIYPDIYDAVRNNPKIEALMLKPETVKEPDQEMKEKLELIEEHLTKAGYRLRFQVWNEHDSVKLLNRLETSFKTVTDVFLACRHNPEQANIHRFRKRTKDLLYQLWFFRPLNPKEVKNLEKKLDVLSQNLGKCNDLSVLLNAIGYRYSGTAGDPGIENLALAIRREQDKYLSEIWPPADKIFSPGKSLFKKLGFRILIL